MKKSDEEKVAASYPLRVQAIRSKGQNARFYVYLPMPLAAAIGIGGGRGGLVGAARPTGIAPCPGFPAAGQGEKT